MVTVSLEQDLLLLAATERLPVTATAILQMLTLMLKWTSYSSTVKSGYTLTLQQNLLMRRETQYLSLLQLKSQVLIISGMVNQTVESSITMHTLALQEPDTGDGQMHRKL